jgi:hypothetical protein
MGVRRANRVKPRRRGVGQALPGSSASSAETAHEIDHEADQQDESEAAAGIDGPAHVQTATAEEEYEHNHEEK